MIKAQIDAVIVNGLAGLMYLMYLYSVPSCLKTKWTVALNKFFSQASFVFVLFSEHVVLICNTSQLLACFS